MCYYKYKDPVKSKKNWKLDTMPCHDQVFISPFAAKIYNSPPPRPRIFSPGTLGLHFSCPLSQPEKTPLKLKMRKIIYRNYFTLIPLVDILH